MALLVHYPAPVPKGRTPPAPIFMSQVSIEDKPTALHLGVAQLPAAATRHLTLVERKVHVLGGIAVQVIDLQRAVAFWKTSGRKSV